MLQHPVQVFFATKRVEEEGWPDMTKDHVLARGHQVGQVPLEFTVYIFTSETIGRAKIMDR
jgi:hypothetical protein